ncbi:hypothetical protein XELAEV_18030718mg [Xenopus laevis]|uniref:Uncharacterized protein n=1 Tax=Xenopus laevis TaxID=8355 RepID=A0A974CMI3_XENLA|nr:hypothetical protein XELAEV_18030718mg [Xenopus laevis]
MRSCCLFIMWIYYVRARVCKVLGHSLVIFILLALSCKKKMVLLRGRLLLPAMVRETYRGPKSWQSGQSTRFIAVRFLIQNDDFCTS